MRAPVIRDGDDMRRTWDTVKRAVGPTGLTAGDVLRIVLRAYRPPIVEVVETWCAADTESNASRREG